MTRLHLINRLKRSLCLGTQRKKYISKGQIHLPSAVFSRTQQAVYSGSECFENSVSCIQTLVFSEDVSSELTDRGLSGISPSFKYLSNPLRVNLACHN